jgi:hypothetical protein
MSSANITNDLGSNLEENLERWAKMLRNHGRNRTVFDRIYSSKQASWSNAEVAAKAGIGTKAASEATKALHDRALLVRLPGSPARYSKRADVYREKKKLLALANSPRKLAALPTKRKPLGGRSTKPPAKFMLGHAIHITVDDIDSFAAVKKIDKETVPAQLSPARLSEEVFKKGIENILGERTKLKDWGGENLDLYSTNLVIKGRRKAAGFALKGPAKTGPLTPGKMGTNGDQIDRLLSQSIDVAIVQYEGDVAISIPSLLEKLARDKARSEEKNIYFCVINLLDSYRLRIAYPSAFRRATADYEAVIAARAKKNNTKNK